MPSIDAILSYEEKNSLWFQHDGAPPHNARCVKDFLDEKFPSRWIGRGGRQEWPPRSPDLTPLDFFLWSYIKSKICHKKPKDLTELRRDIENEFQRIPQTMLINVQKSVLRRTLLCKQNNGKHFEHLFRKKN
jgi:hypothetical protein